MYNSESISQCTSERKSCCNIAVVFNQIIFYDSGWVLDLLRSFNVLSLPQIVKKNILQVCRE